MKPGSRQTFRVPSRLDALGSVRAQVLELALAGGLSPEAAEDLVLCVHEAASNAIVHGHREDESLLVEIAVEAVPGGLQVEVSNQGPGFDVAATLDSLAAADDQPRGRGLRIIETLADEHRWSNHGRQVTLLKRA